MAVGLSEILPDSLFFPDKKPETIRFLKNVPAPGTTKRSWLFLWALWVGSRINKYDYAAVQEGSIDE
jgi:hypothetical protein